MVLLPWPRKMPIFTLAVGATMVVNMPCLQLISQPVAADNPAKLMNTPSSSAISLPLTNVISDPAPVTTTPALPVPVCRNAICVSASFNRPLVVNTAPLCMAIALNTSDPPANVTVPEVVRLPFTVKSPSKRIRPRSPGNEFGINVIGAAISTNPPLALLNVDDAVNEVNAPKLTFELAAANVKPALA